jgi:hypothetical protein
MKRTTIVLPDDVDAWFRYEARRRGISLGQLAREAIATHVAHPSRTGDLGFFGAGDRDQHGATSDPPYIPEATQEQPEPE